MDIQLKVLSTIGPVQIVGRRDGLSTAEVFSLAIPEEIEDELCRQVLRRLYHNTGLSAELERDCCTVMMSRDAGPTVLRLMRELLSTGGSLGPLTAEEKTDVANFIKLVE